MRELLYVLCVCTATTVTATAVECNTLVEEALEKFSFPSLEIRANSKLDKHFYVGVSVSVPLYSGSERRRIENNRLQKKKELLKAIADIKNAASELQLHRKLLKYHKKRVEKAIEDNEKLLKELQKIEELQAQKRESEAVLKAYGIDPKKAQTCRW
ncbi:TolC family protein [Thermovibrio ammonificans]